MESEPSNPLQTQLKLARRSLFQYSNRLKKKRKRKSTVSGPSPAALLLKAALEQPTLDHVIIPITTRSSDDESSSAEEHEKKSLLIPELRSTLKEIQKCKKLIDEQMERFQSKKDMGLLQFSISALSDSAEKFIELAQKQIEKIENPKSTDSSAISQFSDDNLDELFYDALDTNLTLKNRDNNEEDSGSKMIRRRTKVPNRPSNSINYLSFLKNCLSKTNDLSKIGMPVDFNEPLSALQRCTEDLDYSYLLDEAANESDPHRRLALVSIFALTAYSTTSQRTSKPFNPLLSETFECDRRQDRGFISISEQCSHHPPTGSLFAKGRNWKLNQAYTPTTKIKGRSLYLNPVGSTYISFNDSPDVFVYGKACTITTMTNLMSGKLQTEINGDLTILNTTSMAKCILKFHESSYFSRETPRKVTGTIIDRDEKPHYEIDAVWDRHAILHKLSSDTSNLIWKAHPLPKDSDKMHNFTRFAIELNEHEEGLPPTDSRYRIDQRVMEKGDWPHANQLKQQLEEAQRKRRKDRDQQGIDYKPLWFRIKNDDERIDNNDIYEFDERYFQCKQNSDWSECPRIFDI